MWTKARLYTISFFALLFLSSAPSFGSCSEAQTNLPETLSVSRADWIALQENNRAQKIALEESQRDLAEARKAQAESEKALNEANLLLEASQMTSTEMQEKFLELSRELALQKAETATLRKELSEAKRESSTASDALTKANQYLSDTKKEIEANEAAWRRRENQLERQRLLWQIVAVLLGGGIALAT